MVRAHLHRHASMSLPSATGISTRKFLEEEEEIRVPRNFIVKLPMSARPNKHIKKGISRQASETSEHKHVPDPR